MGFISYSLNYYKNELEKIEQGVVSKETIYKAKQLLKMLDDLLDEGYTELNKHLEAEFQGASRLRNYLEKNGAKPFAMPHKVVTDAQVTYGNDKLELTQVIETMISGAEALAGEDVGNSSIEIDTFLEELLRFCEWIGYEEDTAYIFLLRDTLLPYIYYRAKSRTEVYPWLLGRKTLEALSGKSGVDDEIRAAVIKALEEEKGRSFNELCEAVLPGIRSTLKDYPKMEQDLKNMLAKIKKQRILVIESGCTGTFPMLLAALDKRVDVRMYTTYPYLKEAYGDRIFTTKYEENRLFETLYSQDLYLQFLELQDGRFYVKKCENEEVEKRALEEVRKML